MTDGKGTLQTIGIYWLVLGVLLVGTSILYGTLFLPLLGAIFLVEKVAFAYALYSVIGFLVMYSVDTVKLLRHIQDLEEMLEAILNQVKAMGRSIQFTALIFVFLYLYSVISIGVLGAYVADIYIGFPVIGLIFAILYPGWDLHNAVQDNRKTIGKLLLVVVLGIFHFFGALRGLTADGVIQSASPMQ
jgi:hypothetical protein